MTFEKMLKKIRYQIQTKRIRVGEFFKDYDKLRSWTIKRDEFIRGVSRIGIDLNVPELAIIADHYTAPNKRDCCKWKDFEADIERVFGPSHLESQPTLVPLPLIVQNTPFVVESVLTQTEEELLEVTIAKMKEHLHLRNSVLKPFFKDFDHRNSSRGYVTKSEFRQCLTYAQCPVTDQEFDVLAKKWRKSEDDPGLVCYLLFLTALNNSETSPPKVAKAASEFIYDFRKNIKEILVEVLEPDDAEILMNRLKTKIKTQRLRVIDAMKDFDLLKHGVITKNEFRRALNVSFVNLSEVRILSFLPF
jgi:hypothetical protein